MITMYATWMTKYHNRPEFLSYFECEQDYVDAMFAQIVMFNYGVYVNTSTLYSE